jgi:hypothetical protein
MYKKYKKDVHKTWILSSWTQPERSQLVIHEGILVISHYVKLSKYPYLQLIGSIFGWNSTKFQLERMYHVSPPN